MANGQAAICGEHSKAIEQNAENIGELTDEVTDLAKTFNKFIASMGKWQARIDGNFRIVNWVLGIFSIVGTAVLITFVSKLIWGS
jgi:hypothetical protein